MKRTFLTVWTLLLSLLALPALAGEPLTTALPQPGGHRPVVQIAILLDTSNSMDGLIAQAKAELWRIVNEIGGYQKNGQTPLVQVALYEYGKQSLPKESGFIRQVSPFTTDLDVISEALFGLSTNGGDEYCGQVIDRAIGELNWSTDSDDFRAIFIAGNEPFTQGTFDYHKAVAKAVAKHVAVNTIHCGNFTEGAQTGWQEGARLGGGVYLSIDPNVQQVHVTTPYDEEIVKKSDKLSQTYLGYGKLGAAKKARQEAQDVNAKSAGQASAVGRASVKASAKMYANADWDAVDAQEQHGTSFRDAKPDELPPEMAKLAPDQRDAYVKQKAGERAQLQKEMAELEQKRQAFEMSERAKHALKDRDTFDLAVRKALENQLQARKFKRVEEKTPK
jgi:hypothetical protein